MTLKISIIKESFAALRKATRQKYFGAMNPTFGGFKLPKNEDLINLTYKSAAKKLNKTDILTKYCSENNVILEDVSRLFETGTKNLDDVSKEHLLSLAEKGRINLYTPPKDKKKLFDVFLCNRNAQDALQMRKPKGILNYLNGEAGAKESAESLKQMLALEKEGKITPENIAELLKMHPEGYSAQCKEFISMLKRGEVSQDNIQQALLMVENGIPFGVFNPKNLAQYSKDDLHYFAKVLQSSRKELPPQLLNSISGELSKLVKVNPVSKEISKGFLNKFEQNMSVFASSKHSIDDLVNAGGVQLQYSRESFKTNILSQIKHLPENEQNAILSKFGLTKQSESIMSGFPVLAEDGAKLSSSEAAVNNEIKKFLLENKVVLPKGFEEYQGALDSICKTFPEFMFTIGAKQHKTHSKALAEHMLMAMQENMGNPLYKNLGEADKKVLGISTLLHDLNKTEHIIDSSHPFTSSISVNSIVQRMEGLSTTDKNRIINFVENHHWLMKVKDMETVDNAVAQDLAFKFRHGNDFEMAKIFAESDLKAVNTQFFPAYGNKIQSKTVKAVEEQLTEIHSRGKMVFTKDVTLDKAIALGAKESVIGSGKDATKNYVMDAKTLGLDTENIIYHASDDAGLICVAGSCGYGKELVLSASLGRQGHLATFGNCPEFIGFRQMDMSNIGSAFKRNTKYGKSYDKIKGYAFNEGSFAFKVQNQYPITNEQYAQVFKEVSSNNMKLTDIHSNKNIQKILGGEAQAKEFETAVKNVNKELESTPEGYKEVVIMDSEIGFIGTKRRAAEMSYNLRKFCEDNKILIVEF